MTHTLFRGSIRYFFFSFFVVLGIFTAITLGIVGVAALSGKKSEKLDYDYKPKIIPNASGVRKVLDSSAPVILSINLSGLIGVDKLKADTLREILIESREKTLKNNRVKAILLRINTPGGTASDSDTIYRLIQSYKEQYKIPVFAYVDGICASGGVYVACSADKIFASEASIIGSVGVLVPTFFNFTKIMETIGIQAKTLLAGKHKDSMNPFRPWKEEDETSIQNILDAFYQQFVTIVVSNRKGLDKEKLITDYGANIFPAHQAKEYGFIDESGSNLQDVIKLLAHEIGVEDDYYQVVEMEAKSWLLQLFESRQSLFPAKIVHQLHLSPDLHPELINQFLYLYVPGNP